MIRDSIQRKISDSRVPNFDLAIMPVWMIVLACADFKNLDAKISETRNELKQKVNKLRDLEHKEELRGFDLNPLSKEEMEAVQNVL